MTATLLGIGTARPPRAWTRDETLAFVARRARLDDRQRRQLRALYRRSGVSRRHLVGDESLYPQHAEPSTATRMGWYETHAGPLAQRAASAALTDAGLAGDAITHLVTVSCTGFAAPGVDIHLMTTLGLPSSVRRTHVGFMGCHGLINALGAAQAYARDPDARVLVCAVELCSLHMQYGWEPDRVVTHALFADGAAALVVGPGDGWTIDAVGSLLVPDSTHAMGWSLGDAGFEMTLSPAVPDLIGARLRPWLSAWLGERGVALEDVGCWAVHPGGPRVLDAVEASLDLPREATAVSREVLDTSGNMSSATVGFLVQRLRQRGAAGPCVALAFGPGLVAEAALLVARP